MRVRRVWIAAAMMVATCGPAVAWSFPVAQHAQAGDFQARVAAIKAAMMADPARALAMADQALRVARAHAGSPRADLDIATAEWLDGEAHLFLDQPEQAVPLITSALVIVDRNAPGTKLQGDLLRSRGAISVAQGRIQDALVAFQRAYRVFTVAHEPRQQSLALSDLGQVYDNAGDYERALGYYAQSSEAYGKDPLLLLSSYNNRAEVLRKLHRSTAAEAQYEAALRQADLLRSPVLQARILANIASIQTDLGLLRAARVTADRAYALTGSGEAAGWRRFVLGTQARIAVASGDLPQAGTLLTQMFAGVDLTKTDMQYREFHQTASEVFARLDQPKLALAHLIAFHRLEDGARDATASVGSQLLAAQFDFTNQNLHISKLQKGQLERDYKLVKQRSLLLTVALSAGAVVFALLLFGTFSLRRSRNRVRAGNVTLTDVNDKLAKALAAKTEFLATTSHEIRTPLNGILGMAQVLLARDGLDQEAREKVELLHGAGETMRALVDDILDVAKMEKGDVSVQSAPTALRKLLRDTASLWRGHAEAKGLTLDLEIDVPATILSDESRLRQIVSNLLSNAVKFTEHGSVFLTARVGTDAAGRETLCVIVTDTGIGIAKNQQALVFDAFHQVDGATTRQFSGTGLGLAICRRLAQAFGGSLTVDSEPRSGAVFALRIPLARPMTTDASEPAATQRPALLAHATVLLVGTDFITHGILASLLEPHVGAFEVAHGCDQALAVLESGRFHHLLIDASARLQRTEGLAAIRALIMRADASDLLSTLLIAGDGDVQVADLLVAGASQSILKPITGNALVEAMRGLYASPAEQQAEVDQAA